MNSLQCAVKILKGSRLDKVETTGQRAKRYTEVGFLCGREKNHGAEDGKSEMSANEQVRMR